MPFFSSSKSLSPARLRRRQCRLAGEVGVVLAGEGMERRIFRLEAGQGETGFLDRLPRVVEHTVAEQAGKLAAVLGLERPIERLLVGRHLERRVERPQHLLLQRGGAAVPEHAALGHDVVAVAGFRRPVVGGGGEQRSGVGGIPLCNGRGLGHGRGLVHLGRRCLRSNLEGRRQELVGQARRGPDAGPVHGRSTELDREIVGRRVVVRRVVAERASHGAGGRERRVEEQLLAERGHGGERRLGNRRCRNGIGRERGRQQGRAREHDARERDELHGRLEGAPRHGWVPQPWTLPVVGSSVRAGVEAFQSNIGSSLPAMASNEPWPMRSPPSQLSSMNFSTELWSVSVWST